MRVKKEGMSEERETSFLIFSFLSFFLLFVFFFFQIC